MDDVLTVPQGAFVLRRAHHDDASPLRAWDAGDEYALAHVAETSPAGDRWLLVNDRFGALAVALADRRPTVWSDSVVGIAASRENLARNGLDADGVTFVPGTDTPTGPFDVVVVKVPRTLSFLQDELARLRDQLAPGATVIGAGMTKDVHRSTIAAFETHVGPTPTTRARKKARLLLASIDPSLPSVPPPSPPEWSTDEGVVVTSLANVFSAERLDDGTRFLLAHLPDALDGRTVIDLACGNGVVGATLARRHPGVHLICCDESFQAVEAARRTVGRVTDDAEFHVIDVLDGIPDAVADLVVVNPPFHAAGARTSAVAHRMFDEARRVLRPGGELRAVGNRHLHHHAAIERAFGSVTVSASDPRFVIVSARDAPLDDDSRTPRRSLPQSLEISRMPDDDMTDEERAYCGEHDLDVRRVDGVLCAEWDDRWVPFDLGEDPPVPKRQTLISASVEAGGFMGDEATYELGKIDDTTLVSISYMDGAGTQVSIWNFEAGTEDDQIQGFIDDMRELEPDAVEYNDESDDEDEETDDVRIISFYRGDGG